jgi:hypothetical protein
MNIILPPIDSPKNEWFGTYREHLVLNVFPAPNAGIALAAKRFETRRPKML